MPFIDYMVAPGEAGIRVETVVAATLEALRKRTKEFENLGYRSLNELAQRIHRLLYKWGYVRDRDYSDTLARPVGERVRFGSASSCLFVVLPCAVLPAEKKSLIRLTRAWLTDQGRHNVEVVLAT